MQLLSTAQSDPEWLLNQNLGEPGGEPQHQARTLPDTHQGFRHDDANLAFRKQGEVGKQALQDKLARFTLGVHVYGCHGDGTFPLSQGSTDWWDGWLQSHWRG